MSDTSDDEDLKINPVYERFVWNPGDVKVFDPDGNPWKPGDPVPDDVSRGAAW
ncbi:hypothetical protein [Protofrankia symbiont of Coriaria ruscifolia]|uniref:hypothetical protein n=1 Tax=Protofrankia symbiont of Coriaria ruscifolia TaxID=1306542 RepID=UPI0013EF99FA|nr:hypothetical protein [Protofrankia symbiont of Coriaria ruscifolia]